MGGVPLHRLRSLLVVALSGALAASAATRADAAATNTLARWEMNESSGSSVMVDASGNGVDGYIGTDVVTGVTFDGATGFKFPFVPPNQPPANPERLVQLSDSRLNPGTRDYAVTIRYRTTRNFGNIIQKGQAGARGGYFKFQQPNGIVSCLFRGADGSKAVNSGRPLNDGAWHTVRCERTSIGVTMTIDGTTTRRGFGATGNIANKAALTIGGKLNCDQEEITCDYFVGEIDRIQIETS